MKRYIITSIVSLSMAFGLGSCSSDESLQAGANASGGMIRFSLVGDSRAKTRTETQLDREKTVSSVLAVAFKRSTGLFATCATAEDISGSPLLAYKWRADLGTPDLYDVYFVANADDALKTAIEELTDASTKADFFAIEATQRPGEDNNATNFLMTSEKVDVDIDSDPDGTPITGEIAVTRAAARIDVKIDDNVLASVSEIELKNRYTSTKVARMGDDVAMTDLDKEDKAYTVNLTGSDKELKATIYAYEDPSKSTELVITGKLADGTDVTPTIHFDKLNNGAGIALQRNYLYTIQLSKNNDPADVGDVTATVIVKDWQTGDVITQSNTVLGDRTAPAFEIAASGTGWTYDSGTKTVTLAAATATSFTVTVNNAGSTLSKLVCKDQVEGFTVSEGARTVSAAGKPIQTFTVNIEANTTGEAREFNFWVENLLDADATGTDSFKVSQPAS